MNNHIVWIKKFSPWIAILAIVAWWHSWRGVTEDVWIHGVIAGLLLLDTLRINVIKPFTRKKFSLNVNRGIAIFLLVALTVSTRHSDLNKVLLGLLAIFSFYMVWTEEDFSRYKNDALHKRTNRIWWTTIVLFLIVECTAFMLASSDHGNDEMYPALSVLLNPYLNEMWTRGVLVALWMALGLKLLRMPVRK